MTLLGLGSIFARTPGSRPASLRRRRPRVLDRPEALEARRVPATYTMPLVNATGLDASKFSIYVDGFSLKSGLTLQPSATAGVLSFAAQGGTVSSYEVGTGAGEFSSIQFDTSQTIDGARVYLFVVPIGQTPPSFPFGQQPANPPGFPFPYVYVEVTQPSGGGRPTVDVSTVDGYTFPVTLTLNAGLGQVGQPLSGASANRAAILAQYGQFMKAPARAMYRALQLPASPGTNGQSGGLLNPYTFLAATSGINPLPANAGSPLNRVFDAALNVLYKRSGWSLMGVDGHVYTAKAGTYAYGSQTNPVTGQAVTLPGLQFTGGGNTFTAFNPTGVNELVGANGKPIFATSVANNLNQVTLANPPAASALHTGMYVFGTYFDQANGLATNYVTGIANSGGKTVVTLKNPLPFAVTSDQVVFSELPHLAIMEATSGAMVFGGAGFFADAGSQGLTGTPATILSNLLNQINSALNRGVAVVPGTKAAPGPLSPSSTGFATKYWGTQSNWYPAGQPMNLFSLFLHTARVQNQPIFVRPANPAKTRGGAPMAMAYGFSFDENPGPVPPAPGGQPQVPSKFDPVPDGTTTITVTLGPWTGSSGLAARPGRRLGHGPSRCR